MKCQHCNENIYINDADKYFVKLSCPNCGHILFDKQSDENAV